MTVDGIAEFTALEGALFPVPVTDALNVCLATPLNSAARVDVRDIQGRLIESTQMLPNQQVLVLDAASGTLVCTPSKSQMRKRALL